MQYEIKKDRQQERALQIWLLRRFEKFPKIETCRYEECHKPNPRQPTAKANIGGDDIHSLMFIVGLQAGKRAANFFRQDQWARRDHVEQSNVAHQQIDSAQAKGERR